jgi:hypothetical protein
MAVASLLALHPAIAALKRAPTTGVTLSTNVSTNAQVAVEGHATYTKTLMTVGPYPPGSYQYIFTSHDDNVGADACGTDYCDDTSGQFYYHYICTDGAGDGGDAVWVTFDWDARTYVGANTFHSFNWSRPGPAGSSTFHWIGDYDEFDWGGGPSGIVTTENISYHLGAWQGSPYLWTSTTSTGSF